MKNTQLMSLENVFKLAGYNYKDMPEESFVDVSDKNIKLKSFNHKSNKIEYRKLLGLVRKKDSVVFEVKTLSGDILLKCTGDHYVFCKDYGSYLKVSKLKKENKILLEDGNTCEVQVINTGVISPILDVTVEKNENYFTNGLLSHNTGGNALKFYASVRMDIRRIETLKKGDEAYGIRVKVKIVKNKVAPPFRQAEFEIIFDSGINQEGSVLEMATKYEIVERSGTWYSYKGERIGQGKNNVQNYLKENKETYNEISKELYTKIQEINSPPKEEDKKELEEKPVRKRKEQPELVDIPPLGEENKEIGEPVKNNEN